MRRRVLVALSACICVARVAHGQERPGRQPDSTRRFEGGDTRLEQGLRASPLGPALAGVAPGKLFMQSSAVPVLALGNTQLRPEQITSWELGYTAEGSRPRLSATAFYDRINDFTTDILPGVNPAYAPWTAPDAVPPPVRGPVQAAALGALSGLTRLPNGSTAYVVSYGNEGRATEWGSELGASLSITNAFRADASYSMYRSALPRATVNRVATTSMAAPS